MLRSSIRLSIKAIIVPNSDSVVSSNFSQAGGDYRVITLLFADGVLNWLQNIIAFSVLSLVTPLTYSVASASKRIFVIAVSLFILGNPVTWMNVFGMMLAVLGVLVYNQVGFREGLNRDSSIIIIRNVFFFNRQSTWPENRTSCPP